MSLTYVEDLARNIAYVDTQCELSSISWRPEGEKKQHEQRLAVSAPATVLTARVEQYYGSSYVADADVNFLDTFAKVLIQYSQSCRQLIVAQSICTRKKGTKRRSKLHYAA